MIPLNIVRTIIQKTSEESLRRPEGRVVASAYIQGLSDDEVIDVLALANYGAGHFDSFAAARADAVNDRGNNIAGELLSLPALSDRIALGLERVAGNAL